MVVDLHHHRTAVRMLNVEGLWIAMPEQWGGILVKMRSLKGDIVQKRVNALLQARRAARGGRFANGTQPLPDEDLAEVNRLAVLHACVDLGTDFDMDGPDGSIRPSEWGTDREVRAEKAREVLARYFLGDADDSYDPAFQQALQSTMAYLDVQGDRELMARAGKAYVFGADIDFDSEG